MTPTPFDRETLTGDASLNKLVVSIGEYSGLCGADLLSRDAVHALVPALAPDALSDELPRHPAIAAMAAEVGRRVAVLVTTLRRGPHRPELSGRTADRVRALDEWTAISDVMLGGGLVAGTWGELVLAAARVELAALDGSETTLTLAPHAPHLGLIGAARSGAFDDGQHLVIDGGQTSIKSAIVTVAGGAIRTLQLLPPTPFDRGVDVAAAIDAVLCSRESRDCVPCSIAAYVRDGQPIVDGASPYEALRHAPAKLLDRLMLIHDGAAAWRGTDRTTSSAVIVMGSWLGVGMGPHPRTSLSPLSSDFKVLPPPHATA